MIISFSSPVRPMGLPRLDSQELRWLVNQEKFTEWLTGSSSSVLTLYGETSAASLCEHVFRHVLNNKKSIDIATHFSFDDEYPEHGTFGAFLNTTMSEWLNLDAGIAENCSIDVDYTRFEKFNAYTDVDAMSQLVLSRVWDVPGATIFVLENDDECREMETIFWPQLRHAMASFERPLKFILFRRTSSAPEGWLSTEPSICISGEDLTRATDLVAQAQLGSVLTTLPDKPLIHKLNKYTAEHGDDLRKATLVLRNLQARRPDFDESMDDILPAFEATFSKRLDAILEQIVGEVNREAQPLLAGLISCVLAAVRPLSRGELQDAADILRQSLPAHAQTSVSPGDVFAFLDQHLPGVFDFSRGEVRLQHPSLRYFFLSAVNAWHSAEEQGAECVIARVCLFYLRSSAFALASEAMLVRWKDASAPPLCCARTNLADYAVRYWSEHACKALESSESFDDEMLEFFEDDSALRSWERGKRAISNPFLRGDEVSLPPLALAASARLPGTLERWIETRQYEGASIRAALTEVVRTGDLEVSKHLLEKVALSDMAEAEPILLAAFSKDNEEICCLLISSIAESIADPKWHPNLICRAAFLGHDRLVQLLVHHGASVKEEVNGCRPLHYAIIFNHAAVVRFLIKEHPELVEMQDDRSNTPLRLAVAHGHAEVADILIEAGAEINVGENWRRPISTACFDGKRAAVRVLLERGADVEYEVGEYGWLPLPGAASFGFTKCVAAILDSGRADIDRRSPGGTGLCVAVRNGHLETARFLLERGADPDVEFDDKPVIQFAALEPNLDAARLLLESGRISRETRTRTLHAAVTAGTSVEMVRLLLEHGADPNGQTPTGPVLHAAVHGKNVDILNELINKGARLDIIEDRGYTALHEACNNVSMAEALLEAGADANFAATMNGATPLHLAVDWCELDVLKAILKRQPELELKTSPSHNLAGFTPLAIAVWRDSGEMTRLLLEAGADPNARTGRYNRAVPLQLSTEAEVVSALLEFEPDLSLEDADGNTPLNNLIEWSSMKVPVLKMLIRQGSDVNKPNKRGETPLFKAIDKSDMALVRLLLDRGADVDHASRNDGTPLHAACRRGTFDVFELILNKAGFIEQQHPLAGSLVSAACMRADTDDDATLKILQHLRDSYGRERLALDEIVCRYGCALNVACFARETSTIKWLLREQANVDIGDHAGRRPIHFAAYRDVPIFEAIYGSGADLNVRDKMGRTVLHVAVQSGSYDLVKHVLDKNRSLLKAPDNDGWTPLHYAVRGMHCWRFSNFYGPDSEEAVVELLLDGNDRARQAVKVFGHEEPWSILKLARFHDASVGIRRIIKAFLKAQSGNSWDPSAHVTRKASDNHNFCDNCYIVSLPSSLILVQLAITDLGSFLALRRTLKGCGLLANHATCLTSVTSVLVTRN